MARIRYSCMFGLFSLFYDEIVPRAEVVVAVVVGLGVHGPHHAQLANNLGLPCHPSATPLIQVTGKIFRMSSDRLPLPDDVRLDGRHPPELKTNKTVLCEGL